MVYMRAIFLFLLPVLFLTACLTAPEYPIEPHIEYLRMTKGTMVQNQLNTDSLLLTIGFTDGDGDIGLEGGGFDLFITDTRDNVMPPAYRIPKVPEQGIGNGISGEISFIIYTTCCYFPNGQDPCTSSTTYPVDTLSYLVYINDRAGHQSNVIETPPILLQCQ
ncbi:MAG: hypothetical protein K9I85_08940 [Saprospiraceae bacterium]|nr:hypothetical protein [Saprospiraceae bacterium]